MLKFMSIANIIAGLFLVWYVFSHEFSEVEYYFAGLGTINILTGLVMFKIDD